MSKTSRLIELMITINAKRKFTARELAQEFGVSKRTILRDLQELEAAGFPLYSEVGAAGGYRVLRERVLPPIVFSENEAMAMFLAYQSLMFYHDLPFEQESVSALKKFFNFLPSDVQQSILQIQNKIVFWVPERHCKSPLLKDLFNAVLESKVLNIEYTSTNRKSVRQISPIGLYAMNGLWYCPAWCYLSSEIREFRVDRIENFSVVEDPQPLSLSAKIPRTIREYLNQLEQAQECRIKIVLSAKGIKLCESEFLLARGLVINEDGGAVIDMTVPYHTLDWISDYLLRFGTEATILEPQELLDGMKNKIRILSEHYCVT